MDPIIRLAKLTQYNAAVPATSMAMPQEKKAERIGAEVAGPARRGQSF